MSYEIHFDDLASSLLEFGININDFGVDIIEESSSIADLSADFFKATTVDNIEFAQNMEKTTAHVMMGSSFFMIILYVVKYDKFLVLFLDGKEIDY